MIFAGDIENNNLTQTDNINESDLAKPDNFNEVLETSDDENSYSNSNIITIEVDKENPNQVLNPTIQPAIDAANPGDTIILKGDFVHCHFLINKTINIIAYDATLGPCPHHQTEDSGSFGVFYVTEEGSGSVFNGITFKNNARAVTPFAFLIRGASDVTINDCIINYPEESDYKYQSIVIEDSQNVNLSNLVVSDAIEGIKIVDSANININNSTISNCVNQAISISGTSNNINIVNNSIINNKKWGLNLASADNIVVINNLIKNNGLGNQDNGSGIYVNTNITSLIVKGNIFLKNALHAIMYDYRARNLNNQESAENLTVVDNNYFEGHTSMVLHHRVYVERDYGTLKYDAENDEFGVVGEGSYAEGKSYVYMRHALIHDDVPCGFTYYTTQIPWTLEASGNDGKYDFSLKLNISQIKNGIYKVSIVDSDGNVAEDFNSFNLVFFLNGFATVEPRENDIYKTVSLHNGVAIADFSDEYSSFKTTGNVITAVFPGLSKDVKNSLYVQLNVTDSDIPINPTTNIVASKFTTYPLSGGYYSVKLLDSNARGIENQVLTFKFNGETYSAKTNSNGIAKVKVSLTSKKTYSVAISYAGNDIYKNSQSSSSIIVKTGTKKSMIKASNVKVKKNKKSSYQIKLTNGAGKAIKNQKVTVKLNGKTYSLKTDSKGIVKLSFKLTKVKKYKVSIKYLGNANYKAVSKTTTITVTKK